MTANLPVLADPVIATMPTEAVFGWLSLFAMIGAAARTFDELYPANRTEVMLDDHLYGVGDLADPEARLFDYYEGRF